MINARHNSQNKTDKNLRSGEEQRRLLCRNNAGTRCSSLDFEDRTFSDEQIDSFIAFALVLKRIHVRLLMEGFTIENGRIYKK